MAEPNGWLSKLQALQRVVAIFLLLGGLLYFAVTGVEEARTALITAATWALGHLFGERARSKADG